MAGFIIKGRMPGMNEYTLAQRRNMFEGAHLKKTYQDMAMWSINNSSCEKIEEPVVIIYRFYEPNRRRDKDNVSAFAHKVIQDALVKMKLIKNDGWVNIEGYLDIFYVDENNPRIEVEIRKGEEWQRLRDTFG